MSIYEIFDFTKIFEAAVNVVSAIAMLLSFFGVVALYKVRGKVK